MVKVAVELLLERIDNPKKQATHHRFSSEIMVRGSTAHTPFD
jgi:DNA-binding LacI/PurR family transcriptional regulator